MPRGPVRRAPGALPVPEHGPGGGGSTDRARRLGGAEPLACRSAGGGVMAAVASAAVLDHLPFAPPVGPLVTAVCERVLLGALSTPVAGNVDTARYPTGMPVP